MEFLARGGGVVTIHAAAVSKDHDWFKDDHRRLLALRQTKWLEAPMSLYFTDNENPITKDMSNFDIDDEIYYDMDLLPECEDPRCRLHAEHPAAQRRQQRSPGPRRRGRGKEEGREHLRHPAAGVDL
jgi:hypothetical protein